MPDIRQEARDDFRLFGLSSCDTCRKARAWLAAHGAAYAFHDLRSDGLDEAMVTLWLAAIGPGQLLNRSSTTWRGLPDSEKALAVTEAGVTALILAHPALVKRPVLAWGGRVIAGFKPEQWASYLPEFRAGTK